MNDQSSKPPQDESDFGRKVGKHETRKLRARHHPEQNIWLGFGLFGLVGWSVAVPTLLGILLGIWLDGRHPGTHSWTLMLLLIGLLLGCANAWYWVDRERKAMQEDEENGHHE